jgi:hypothetical protein
MKLQTNKLSAVFVALLLVTAGGIATAAASAQQDQGEPDVSIDDQNTNGEEVTLASVAPPEGGGFVALHEGSADGPVIGTSEYVAEQDRNVRVQIDQSLGSDATVVAVLHEDTDGDQALDPSVDQRYETEDGDTVTDEAEVTVRGSGEGVAEEENETEEAENETEEETEEEGFEVSNLRAVDSAPINDTVTVTADVEAPDDRNAGAVELRVAGDVVERRHLSFEEEDERTVEFNVNTTGMEAGTYVHGVFTEDSGEVAQITLTEQNASLNVTNLSAPADAPVGENVTVNATITNDGEENDTQNVTARLNGTVVAQENVTLDAGEETNVSLDVSADEEGTYFLSVLTRDYGEVQQFNVTEESEENETEAPTANVTFENQTSNGSTVVVDAANSSDGTFVAIHDASLLEGNVIGSVIGVSEYLEQGEHENVSVELFDVSGADFAESELTENQTLIAMPHLDTNDNGTYDFVATDGAEDGPYVNETGQPVVDDAFVTMEAMEDNVTNETNVTDNVTDNETNVTDNETNVTDNETEAAATASVEFNDQTTSGEVVGVASTNLSEGGFVVIHDATLLDGDVFGSVIGASEYLEPGEHDSVSVQLYDVPGLETDQTSLEEDQTLIAMAHFDTNDNETYDFLTTGGEEDGAYVGDSGPVIDDAEVTVESFGGNETDETNETNGTVGSIRG